VNEASSGAPASLRGRVALVTGGSRGVGAATILALARSGADVLVNYRNKVRRAEEIAATARSSGVRALPYAADITDPAANARMCGFVAREWGRLDVLVLNASGGMERDLVAADPDYPMRINRDGPLDLLARAAPLLTDDAVVVHVTSHLAHFYGQVEQPPAYEPVARSKHAGEQAIRDAMHALGPTRRFIAVSGDLIEDTIVPRLMDRESPGLIAARRTAVGTLPTTADLADAIVRACVDRTIPNGETLFVGSIALDTTVSGPAQPFAGRP